MKGREESVSKKGIEACCGYWSAANYSGIWWKDWKRRSATTPLERNRPRVLFLFGIFQRMNDSIRRSI